MHKNWENNYLTPLIVLLAFIDGILVAQTFQDPPLAIQGIEMEYSIEQKISSNTKNLPEQEQPTFTSQAPYGLWEDPWSAFAEEACASMAKAWLNKEALGSKEALAEEWLQVKAWEEENLGNYGDTNLAQTQKMLMQWYGLKAEIDLDLSVERLKAQLDQGKVLLVPVVNLENPHYGEPGPVHHMILIYAYEGNDFISHDPGTSKGAGYRYSMDVLLKTVQDPEGKRGFLAVSL